MNTSLTTPITVVCVSCGEHNEDARVRSKCLGRPVNEFDRVYVCVCVNCLPGDVPANGERYDADDAADAQPAGKSLR